MNNLKLVTTTLEMDPLNPLSARTHNEADGTSFIPNRKCSYMHHGKLSRWYGGISIGKW